MARFLFFFSARAAARLESPLAISSRRAARRLRAIWRFWERERVAWDLTTIPVGICFSWTAELVLFCWGVSVVSRVVYIDRKGSGETARGEQAQDVGRRDGAYDLLSAGPAAFYELLLNVFVRRRLRARRHVGALGQNRRGAEGAGHGAGEGPSEARYEGSKGEHHVKEPIVSWPKAPLLSFVRFEGGVEARDERPGTCSLYR